MPGATKAAKKRKLTQFKPGHAVFEPALKSSDSDPALLGEAPEAPEDGPRLRSASASSNSQPEIKHDNRVMPLDKMFKQINATFKGHAKTDCKNPDFALGQEFQWGIMVKQSWKCLNCSFETPVVNLYDEVDTGKSGPKAARQNVAFVAALMHTSIGVHRGQLILNALDVPIPNKKTMFTTSRHVSASLADLSKEGMLEMLHAVAAQAGGEIHLTLDARYNTSRWSCDRRNGLHNTTQFVTLAMANTPSKPIVSQYTENKVCPTGTALLLQGEDIQCPGHPGCTATLNRYEGLTERNAGQHIGRSVGEQGIRITHVTTDGDAKLFKGVEEVTQTAVKRCSDTVHLGQTQTKKAKGIEWSEHLFSGCSSKTRAKKKEYTNALAMDIRNRSFAILKSLHQKYEGQLPEIQKAAKDSILAAICCYQGDCKDCPGNTTACLGTEDSNESSWLLKSSILQEHKITNLNTTATDVELMTDILELVLGHDNLEKTQFLSHTNHNEAANRSMSVSLPKNIKYSRCLHGRVACVIDTWNYGLGEAIRRQHRRLGLNISRGQSNVFKRLQRQSRYHKAYTRSAAKKQLRRKRDSYLRLSKRQAQPHVTQGDYDKHHLDNHNYSQVNKACFLHSVIFIFISNFVVIFALTAVVYSLFSCLI